MALLMLGGHVRCQLMRVLTITLCTSLSGALLTEAGRYCVKAAILKLVTTNQFDSPSLVECPDPGHRCIECVRSAEDMEFKVYTSFCGATALPKSPKNWTCRDPGTEPCDSPFDFSGKCFPLLKEVQRKHKKCQVIMFAEAGGGQALKQKTNGEVFCDDEQCGVGAGYDSNHRLFAFTGCMRGCQRMLRDAVAARFDPTNTKCRTCPGPRYCEDEFNSLVQAGRSSIGLV